MRVWKRTSVKWNVRVLAFVIGWLIVLILAKREPVRDYDAAGEMGANAVTTDGHPIYIHTQWFGGIVQVRRQRKVDFDSTVRVPIVDVPWWAAADGETIATGFPFYCLRRISPWGGQGWNPHEFVWLPGFLLDLLICWPLAHLIAALIARGSRCVRYRWVTLRREEKGLCWHCDYDLTALPHVKRCPECGGVRRSWPEAVETNMISDQPTKPQ